MRLEDGRELGTVITALVPELVPRVIAQLVSRLPSYGAMPVEQLAGDVEAVIERSIRGFADALGPAGKPSDELLGFARDSAMRRGEEGIPIEAILDAYVLGIQECVDFLRADLLQAEAEALLELMSHVLRFEHLMLMSVASGFLEQRESAVGETEAARSALLSALIEGGDIADAAWRTGITLPTDYLVLAVAVGPHADEVTAEVDPTVAARRKVRRLRVALEGLAPDQVLTALSRDGGIALLPWPGVVSDRDELHHLLATAAGAPLMLAVEAAVPSKVPHAVRLTHEVLDVAQRLDLEPGAYALSDVLLDYQLMRPSPARDQLAARLDAISDQPRLVETLTIYLAHRRRRRATAAALNVHPNTVDNRLQRISELTGLDPTDADDVPGLRAALMARTAAPTTSVATR